MDTTVFFLNFEITSIVYEEPPYVKKACEDSFEPQDRQSSQLGIGTMAEAARCRGWIRYVDW